MNSIRYAPRVHGDGNGCSLSSAKVQKSLQSDNRRSCVGANPVMPWSVNGVGVLLTPVNNADVNTFLHCKRQVLKDGARSVTETLTLFNPAFRVLPRRSGKNGPQNAPASARSRLKPSEGERERAGGPI